jgi:uncharacterized protein (DUF1778 family)
VSAKKTISKAAAPAQAAQDADKGAQPRRRVDWEAVERDYRVGKLTLREIAEKHGATAGRICQVAKEKAWSRGDLQKTVNAATQALLVAEQVNGEVNRVKQGLNDAVLGAAELNKQVILTHRQRVKKAADVVMRMLEELDRTTTNQEALEQLFELAGSDMDERALANFRQQFRDFMKLHARVASAQKLTAALRDAQNLEAQAFGNLYEGKASTGDETQNLTDEELDGAIAQIEAKLSK